jgi:ribonuclease BN (tRNA processing enzyme)
MKLVFLGTGGYHPSPRRHTPCLLIPECGLMLDAGTGMFRAAEYLKTAELDIFLSHVHLDHVVGLTYLFDVQHAHPLQRVSVHAAPEELAAIDEHLFAKPLFPQRPPMKLQPLAAEVAIRQGGRLTHFPLDHPGRSRGYRLDWPGHSMAYVTDTTARADADYVAKIRGVDLLVHECYFRDEEAPWALKTGHSCVTPVAEVARAAGVGRLILVHVNPLAGAADPVGLESGRTVFARTDLGCDLMEVEF